jgi:hypothetical protein
MIRLFGGAVIGLVLACAALAGCGMVQRTEPHASQDVIDAIYAGMKHAQERPS